jgi:GR25 family glycosyltransferase involved in LPS biosynthesis
MLESLLESFLRCGDVKSAREVVEMCSSKELYNISLLFGEYFTEVFNDTVISLNMANSAYKLLRYNLCYDLYEKIIRQCNLGESLVSEIVESQKVCIKYISDRYSSYNKTIVDTILNKKPKQFPLVTFTVTTCKRYDLFTESMNSFLNCCTDLHRIDNWLCVDDNSSQEDREKMRQNYPFFTFYFKTVLEKGHPRSMNIIRDSVKTPYIFHIEDDWKFFCKRDYITDCLDIVSQDPKIGQCLLNKNYIEVESVRVVGGISKVTDKGKRYYIHEHCKSQEETDAFNRKHGGMSNCAYWPYFSFRPSLFQTKIIQELGEFNEMIGHFEMDYSYRYRDKGYISAFFESIYCLHTGRLTSERFDNSRANAYILNDESQFCAKTPQPINLNIKTYVINLNRRKDRWEKFTKQEAPNCLKYERFSAIDGAKLEPTEQLQRIFDGNDYNMRQGMVGCALSHIKLYIELSNSKYDAFCILEDDIEFVPSFRDKFIHLYNSLENDWDLCYLGHHMWSQYKTREYFSRTAMPVCEKWDSEKSLKYSIGGTGGYLISKKGANALLEFINRNGMTNGIDTVQQKSADTLAVYYPKPHLIYSECCTVDKKVDTDIQYNHNSLTISLKERLEREKKFYLQFGTVVSTSVQPDFTNMSDVTFYTGINIRQCLKKCKYPCYSLDYKVMVIVPQPTYRMLSERYFQRLKKPVSEILGNDLLSWNISDVLKFKPDKLLISFGGAHVYDSLKSLDCVNCEYPFDTLYGGDFSVYSLLSEITLKMSDREIDHFVEDLCNVEKGEIYLQQYNNKLVLKNTRYGVSFPHEDVNKLAQVYSSRFKNFRDIVRSKVSMTLVYSTHWEKVSVSIVNYTLSVLQKYNENVKFLLINTLDKDDFVDPTRVYRENVHFPEEYKNKEWPLNKVRYDQTTFHNSIVEKIKKYL